MHEQLLEILAEPGTGADLELRHARSSAGVIEEGELVSKETGRVYPVVRGIPRFVDPSNYAASFGMQWNRFREIQIDSESAGTHSRDRFDNETGWDAEQLHGKRLLDAGCGAGRFAEIAASRGAHVVALDLSSAVDAAKTTLERFENCDVVQGSVLDPPLKPGTFDFAYCIGVAQHTPSPEDAVRAVVKTVKPGGRFALTIYARRPWTKLNAKYVIRPITKRMPRDALLRSIETVMPVAFPIAERLFSVPKLGRVAQFMVPVAVYLERDRPGWPREQRYREAILDTFDMLSPQFDAPMTWQEVESVLDGLRAADWQFKTRVPINVIGTR
jgi:SAM-dependent methyltransferase